MGTVSLAILSLKRCRANEGKVFVLFFTLNLSYAVRSAVAALHILCFVYLRVTLVKI